MQSEQSSSFSSEAPTLLNLWSKLQKPILTVYSDGIENSEHIIKTVLELTLKSCCERPQIYAPVLRKISPDLLFKQSCEYAAYCTWLQGRLFYFLHTDKLIKIHPLCLRVQSEILDVCSSNFYLQKVLLNEYLGCLSDLAHIQKSFQEVKTEPYLLKRFTPQPLESLAELELMPVYVLVNSDELVDSLELYIAQIILPVLPRAVQMNERFAVSLWNVTYDLVGCSMPPVKVECLKIFATIITRVGFSEDLKLGNMCSLLESLQIHYPQWHAQGRLNAETSKNLTSALSDVFKAITLYGFDDKKDYASHRRLLYIIRKLVAQWDATALCAGNIIQSACECAVKILKYLPPSTENIGSFEMLMSKWETRMCAIDIIVIWLEQDFQQWITKSLKTSSDSSNNESTKLCAARNSSVWSQLCLQVEKDLEKLQSTVPLTVERNEYLAVRDKLGRVQAIVICAVSVQKRLERVLWSKKRVTKPYTLIFFQGKVGKFFEMLLTILSKWNDLTNPTFIREFGKDITDTILKTVADIFCLAEVGLSSNKDIELGASLLSLLWMDGRRSPKTKFEDLNVDARVLTLAKKFRRIEGVEVKAAALTAIANIPRGIASRYTLSIFQRLVDTVRKSPAGGTEDQTTVDLAIAAVHSSPVLVRNPNIDPADVINTVLFKAVNALHTALHVAVSEVFLPVVCFLSGKFVESRVQHEFGQPVIGHICLLCQKDLHAPPSQGENLLRSSQDSLSQFLVLLDSSEAKVRQNMARSLSSLVLHLPFLHNGDIVNDWLEYATDPDQQVRINFSRTVKFLIFHRDWIEGKAVESVSLKEEHIPLTQTDRRHLSDCVPRLNKILRILFTKLETALKENNQPFQETLLASLVDIGCVPLDCVLLPVLKMVIACVSHPKWHHPAIARAYIMQIANSHNTKVENLFTRFRSQLCGLLIQMTLVNFAERPANRWPCFMDKVVDGFGFPTMQSWLQQTTPHVLPHLFPLVVTHNARTFLDRIIELMQVDRSELVQKNFQYIFPHVFLNENDAMVEKCVQLMEELSGVASSRLLIKSLSTIHNVLLLHYHSKQARVREGIYRFMKIVENSSQPVTSNEIADHLKPRFLGVLFYFDAALESTQMEEDVKIKALQSLPLIIRLMGSKYITPVRFKVLSTLRTSLRLIHCDFPHLSCGAWEAFIQCVDLTALGPLLGTVVVSILPLLDQCPDETAGILEWLVVEHEDDFVEYLTELFFVPNKPPIQNVYNVIQRHIEKQNKKSGDFHCVGDILEQPLKFIKHDNVDIRKNGLLVLRSLLNENHDAMVRELLLENRTNSAVAKIANVLVEGCRDSDVEIRSLCVETLGLIGAVDPGRFPAHNVKYETEPKLVDIHHDSFAEYALTVLAKAYHAARNTRYLDSFGLAIQELLKSYEISSKPRCPKKDVWNRFPESIQQVMIPLEDSCYVMSEIRDLPIWPHPLFGTRYGCSLTLWAHTWACRLVTFTNDIMAKRVFSACIPSLKTDINCVLFFLPFIALYSVIPGCAEHHLMMEEEMKNIIQEHDREEKRKKSELPMKFAVRGESFTSLPKKNSSDSATRTMCAKIIFSILDFLENWTRIWKKERETKTGSGRTKHSLSTSEIDVTNVHKFLQRFSKLDLAYGNCSVKEYARALMYLEDYLMEDQSQVKDHLSFLGRIYAQIGEPDGVEGVMAIQCNEPALEDLLVYYELTGHHQDALLCYEGLAKQHGISGELGMTVQTGVVRCCLNLEQPHSALQIVQGVMALNSSENTEDLISAQAECFWRMHMMDELDNVLNDPRLDGSTSWGVSIGRCVSAVRHGQIELVQEKLKYARHSLVQGLSAASLERRSYLQGYQYIVKLHLLHELDEAAPVIANIRAGMEEMDCCNKLQGILQTWEQRLQLVQAVAGVQEPVLRLRRCLLRIARSVVQPQHETIAELLDRELGDCWLKSAEMARAAGHHQQAYAYLLNAEPYKPLRYFIELAKLYWEKKEQERAFSALRRGMEEHFPDLAVFRDSSRTEKIVERKVCAEAKLLTALYNEETSNIDINTNLSVFREAVNVYKESEKSYVHLAEYYARICDSMSPDKQDVDLGAEFQLQAVNSFGKSLMFGCNYIYQSISRLLTMWLDFGKRLHDLQMSMKATTVLTPAMKQIYLDRKKVMDKLNDLMKKFVSCLPPYMFMTGFSQLVSRICHPLVEVYTLISSIIVRLLSLYPQQTLWMLMSVSRAPPAIRIKRCERIFKDQRIAENAELSRTIDHFHRLGTLLIELCKKDIAHTCTKTSVSHLVPALPKLLRTTTLSEIMVPAQKYMRVSLPQNDFSTSKTHSPYITNPPHIQSVKEEVVVLASLQKPRKVVFVGSDGKAYDLMFKDKDDLRIDARVCEFNNIVNKYLQKDPESRSRNLHIRTYGVFPLNDTCGIIEWIPDLNSYRNLLMEVYKDAGISVNHNALFRKYQKDNTSTLEQKRERFLNIFLPLCPPFFRVWFRLNFTDSRCWYEGRASYVRTLAVMSMVGYILGLGDRHGENILLDQKCGDVVHVDFNCLFNKGDTFDCPEVVPFRLTHNMVSAMGPTGVEGAFKHACETTLRVIRKQRAILQSVLRPFVYDPCMSGRVKSATADPSQTEVTNENALSNLQNIERRLNGWVKSKSKSKSNSESSTTYLSVEGQVAFVIQEATDIDNLCQMYIGWLPFF